MLKINDNKIREIVAGTFDEMPNLEELDLSKNKLIACANGWISLMSSLRILQLNDNKFENGESLSLNGVHTDLQYINLLDNPFENLTVRSIMFLPPRAVIDLKHGDDSSCHDDVLVDNDVNQHLDVCR
uniref:U2A'/phosphoprotein 32 family A C-terminal domain-containing protein n=1 Tax=Bracon brevicornis TaxID=1563983 RepID=A0A6V7KQ18_9HYME